MALLIQGVGLRGADSEAKVTSGAILLKPGDLGLGAL
jgi:hypothetical protein